MLLYRHIESPTYAHTRAYPHTNKRAYFHNSEKKIRKQVRHYSQEKTRLDKDNHVYLSRNLNPHPPRLKILSWALKNHIIANQSWLSMSHLRRIVVALPVEIRLCLKFAFPFYHSKWLMASFVTFVR